MPVKLDRRYKILPKERREVRKLYKKLKSIYKVAIVFNVSPTTIFLIINKEAKKRALERIRIRHAFLWRTDEKFRERMRRSNSEKRKYARQVNPKIRKYYKLINRNHPEFWAIGNKKRWAKIKADPVLLKEYAKKHKEWSDKNREHVRLLARRNYYKRKQINIMLCSEKNKEQRKRK